MEIDKSTNKHPVDISKLSAYEMDMKIEKGFQDMLAGRIVPAKKAFVDIRKDYRLEDCRVKEER